MSIRPLFATATSATAIFKAGQSRGIIDFALFLQKLRVVHGKFAAAFGTTEVW